MTTLSLDALTLGHVLITLIAIASGLGVAAMMIRGRYCNRLTALFLVTTFLTSATGFVFFHPPAVTPAQVTGVVALVVLAPTLYGLYRAHLSGVWRPVYVVGALVSLYLNVFVLVIQLFLKVPKPAITGGPVFGATQGLVLVLFLVAGWLAVKRFHPAAA